MDVAEWLRGLGLEQYATAFRENEVGERVLPSLTADDLKELGVNLIGHRRLLLDAIAALREGKRKQAAGDKISTAKVMPAGGSTEADRRQLTIMFCDLVGSTTLSTQLDPEDLHDVITTYHTCCAEHVTRFGGHIAQYLGDGVLAYFGFPRSHEDDPIRAIHTGLAILGGVADLPPKQGPAPQVRIGIATGLVVVGDLFGEAVRARAMLWAKPQIWQPGCKAWPNRAVW